MKGQTASAYSLENNIVNLVRIASNEDMTIPYLVDPETIKFGFANKFDIYNTNGRPLDVISKKLDEAVSEGNKTKEVQLFDEEPEIVSDANLEPFQDLQAMLLEDIYRNKYNKKTLTAGGKVPSKAELNKMKKDLLIIGRSVVPTFYGSVSRVDKEEQQDFAENDYFSTSKGLAELIANHEIEVTSNVAIYRNMLKEVEGVEASVPHELGED